MGWKRLKIVAFEQDLSGEWIHNSEILPLEYEGQVSSMELKCGAKGEG